jgi:hypothetical protein
LNARGGESGTGPGDPGVGAARSASLCGSWRAACQQNRAHEGSTGGRRRSEVASAVRENLVKVDDQTYVYRLTQWWFLSRISRLKSQKTHPQPILRGSTLPNNRF